MRLAVDHWEDVDGYAVAHGLPDLRTIDLGRLAHFVWWLWTHQGSEADKAKFRARLWMPPRGRAVTDRRSPWSAESENAAFAALKAGVGGGR